MKNFFKDLLNSIWGVLKVVLPNNLKKLVVNFFEKNQKLLLYLDPAMRVVKAIALAYGRMEVVSIISAIQRTLSTWGIEADLTKLPATVSTVLQKGAQATLEEAKVALRDTAKLVLVKRDETGIDPNVKFSVLSESQQNLVVELAYNMVKDEIAALKENMENNIANADTKETAV